MQLIEFDPKNIIISILLFLSSCGSWSNENWQHLELDLPKEEYIKKPHPDSNTISVVLFSDISWFCYTDTMIGKGKIYNHNNFRNLLAENKKTKGNNFIVFLKPTKYTSYKTTVDALDLMEICKIKSFQLVALNKNEENFFYSPNFLQTPEPLEINPAETVSHDEIPENELAFYVQIKNDRTILYKTDVTYNKDKYVKLLAPNEQLLENAISEFKENAESKIKLFVYI
ncbi:MAG: biopolymer transporter ExbD [Bacteroidota bacterium]